MQAEIRTSYANAAAIALLALMAALMIASAWDDTIIFDEEPHLAGGLSSLRRADSRFNPEHPPLMKDLAALPLLFLNLNEPWNDRSWEVGEAWDFGAKLLYGSGNDPDTITRAARAPMIAFTVAFGWFFFWWTRREFGNGAALLALFFYAFSPTFLAHGRFVTTDVGAAAGFFVATVAFVHVLRTPSRRNAVLAGLAMGFALLTKFSTILLLPIAGLLVLAWEIAQPEFRIPRGWLRWRRRKTGFVIALRRPGFPLRTQTLLHAAGAILIAFLAVHVVYLHHTWNLPPERQRADTARMLQGRGVGHTPKDITLWASDKPLLRPGAAYSAGLISAVQRSGNDAPRFFFGEIYRSGLPGYLPFVALVKEPLALHLLTAVALVCALVRIRRSLVARERLRSHFTEVAFLGVIAVYWAASITAGINIGVRHVLPTFPFLYVLVASQIIGLIRWAREKLGQPGAFCPAWLPAATLAGLLGWQAASVLRVHPSYLAYFNELAGGPNGGWRYVVDSNVDWGQDLKRLARFVEQRGITELHLDYFGTGSPRYYLQEKFWERSSCTGPEPGWIAVSAMHYQHSREKPECDYRRWLPMEKLVAKIGYSIFVFRVG